MHPYKILNYKGKNVKIDKDIVSLISKLWKAKINTISSCQEECSIFCQHKSILKNNTYITKKTKCCLDNIWILFESIADMEKLYNIVAEFSPPENKNSIYNLMGASCYFGGNIMRPSTEYWGALFLVDNDGELRSWYRPYIDGKRVGYEMCRVDGCKKNKFVIRPSLTIPKKHLSYVESQLDKYLAKK